MSLRKQATILGTAPSYLSMLVNGKRKWPDALRHRYEELVNTPNPSVNKQGSSGFFTAKPSKAMVGQPGFEPGTSVLSGLRSNHLSYWPHYGSDASAEDGLTLWPRIISYDT